MIDPLVLALARRRIALGWSQNRLAAEIGSHIPAISRMESGRHSPTLGTLRRIADALGCDLTLTEVP